MFCPPERLPKYLHKYFKQTRVPNIQVLYKNQYPKNSLFTQVS